MQTEFSTFMRQLAEASGELIRNYIADRGAGVDYKSDGSPVTEADRGAEELMRTMIRGKYPAHGVIGEEYGAENADAEFVWTLDPIDGTISFVAGCPLFGTLIGLLHEGAPILGAIHQPLLGQLCMGDGRKAEINGRRVALRAARDLSEATLLTTDLKYVGKYQSQAGFDALVGRTGLMRTWGDCYGYLLLARGGADIMLDPVMNPWDLIPLIPIIRGAGGVITSWDGGDAQSGTSCVASGPALHKEIIDILNPGRA
jgi:myo-inositol-1(or 4)-monophosphatase